MMPLESQRTFTQLGDRHGKLRSKVMGRHLGKAILTAWALSAVAACSGDEKSKGTDEEKEPAETVSFEKCQASLKACSYDESETACSSLNTAVIPLSDGSTYGDVELKGGPYGAYVEWNEGQAFANPVSLLESTCSIAAAVFMEPASVTADVLDLRGQELGLYTVFRPACMKEGETYPVITWGNGTCGQSGSYSGLLATLASHGFVVVASNSRFTGDGTVMRRALDFAEAANEDPNSALYHKLDLDKVGAMGHSQGAGATVGAASDERIKALILWNGGGSSSEKPFLSISGERDINGITPASMTTAVEGASQPGAWLFYHKVLVTGGSVTGHLLLMMQPERVIDVTVAWWNYQLKGDAEAKKMFVGGDCGLCDQKDEFEFGAHNLE
jgi:hypothetical protein